MTIIFQNTPLFMTVPHSLETVQNSPIFKVKQANIYEFSSFGTPWNPGTPNATFSQCSFPNLIL